MRQDQCSARKMVIAPRREGAICAQVRASIRGKRPVRRCQTINASSAMRNLVHQRHYTVIINEHRFSARQGIIVPQNLGVLFAVGRACIAGRIIRSSGHLRLLIYGLRCLVWLECYITSFFFSFSDSKDTKPCFPDMLPRRPSSSLRRSIVTLRERTA